MDTQLVLVVSLWVDPARLDAFMAYEREAARIMAKYGGRIDRVIRIQTTDEAQPFEVHVIHFPDEPAFERYRADPEIARLSAIRAEVILRTSIVMGQDIDAYE